MTLRSRSNAETILGHFLSRVTLVCLAITALVFIRSASYSVQSKYMSKYRLYVILTQITSNMADWRPCWFVRMHVVISASVFLQWIEYNKCLFNPDGNLNSFLQLEHFLSIIVYLLK